LAILTGVGRPQIGEQTIELSNHATQLMECTFDYSEFHSALFAVEAVILLIGARLCFAVKDVPDAVNESKYIAGGESVTWMLLFLEINYMSSLYSKIIFSLSLSLSLPHATFSSCYK
jgi:Na+-transporting NADH:ubiquinone oxidoreductase subunit NqrB